MVVHMIVSTCRSLKEENKVVLKSLKKKTANFTASINEFSRNNE